MSKKRKHPEFDLPNIIVESITNYLGPRKSNKLSPDQRNRIFDQARACAKGVTLILNEEQKDAEPHR